MKFKIGVRHGREENSHYKRCNASFFWSFGTQNICVVPSDGRNNNRAIV